LRKRIVDFVVVGLNLNDEILDFVDKKRKSILDLCCTLIKAKSENPPGDVEEAVAVAKEFLKKNGLKYETYEPKKGHINLLTRIGNVGKTLIFNGHIDVVPAGDRSKWSFDPYIGEIKGDEILGRGASDMKAGVAAILFTLVSLSKLEKELSGKVIAAIVCDEETGGKLGTEWLLENKKLSGDACILAESSGNLNIGYAVNAGERGVCWTRLNATGRPAHGSTPILGKNAITIITKILPKIQKISKLKSEVPKEAQPLVSEGKKILANVARKHKVPVNRLTDVLDHYSVNVGKIVGGTKTNIVPESCEADLDIRIPPGGSRVEVEKYLRKILPEGVNYEVLNSAEPSYTPLTDPLVKVTREVSAKFLGYIPPVVMIPATSDAHIFREKLGVPCVSFGPGFAEKCHVQDESVKAEDIIRFTKSYVNITLNFFKQ
jgi:succinyl-diaminopimelate desuccinylase